MRTSAEAAAATLSRGARTWEAIGVALCLVAVLWSCRAASAGGAQAPFVSIRRANLAPLKGYREIKVRGRGTNIYISPHDELTVSDIERAQLKDLKNFGGGIGLRLTFTKAGRDKLRRLAQDQLLNPVAVMLNGEVVGAPLLRGPLRANGDVLIRGRFLPEEVESVVTHVWARSDEGRRQLLPELARLAGTWTAVSGVLDGRNKPPPKGIKTHFGVGGRYTTENGGTVTDGGTFRINPLGRPRRIDFTHSIGPQRGKTGYGIYEFKEKQLFLCIAPANGSPRPKDFASPPGKNQFLMIWKKER